MRQIAAIAALLVMAGHTSAEILPLLCRAAIGEDTSTDFIVAVDLATSVITESDIRWTTTHGEATIDWNLNRHTEVLRAVILTGPDAGLLIAGECAAPS